MAPLKPVARSALKRVTFKTPIENYIAGSIDWSHSSLKPLKKLIRKLLRIEQGEVCPYCQRLIIPERRNVNEHIEHILDKSKPKYRKFAFNSNNIILSCHGCNVEKNTKDIFPSGRADPLYINRSLVPFLWPHPYFDDMSACIRKHPGPVYTVITGSGREAESRKLISDLKLNDVGNIESRYSKLVERQYRLAIILSKLIKVGGERSIARMRPLVLENERIAKELNL